MADAPIRATMNQETVGKVWLGCLYLARTAKHPEEKQAAEAAGRWAASALTGVPPLGDFSVPDDEKAAIAEALKGVRFEDQNLDTARQWLIKALERPESPKPPKPPPGGGIAPPLPHATDFLAMGVRTHPYAGYTPAERQQIRDAAVARGYTHLYVYAYNEQDYGGPSFDGLRAPDQFRGLLEEIRAAGLAPVVWLFPDDADTIHGTSTEALKGLLDGFVPVVDDLVSSYVLGLELDEYWDAGKVDALGAHLNGLTDKLIGVHQLQGQWSFARNGWCDYLVLQYGFGKSTSFIANMTKAAITALGKPVVAGEYELDDENHGRPLGDAAVAAGATGFGNGGTPPQRPVPPPATSTLSSSNLLLGTPIPWVAGSLVRLDPAYAGNLAAFTDAHPSDQIVLADMDEIPDQMRMAGFSGRDNALWYTLSRSYAGWDWQLTPGDPDNHLGAQRQELAAFWSNYLDMLLAVMRAKPHIRALFLMHDGPDKCGDILSDYSLRQLAPVADRVERGTVYHGQEKGAPRHD